MNNLLSYCGLVDARISASEKDLPVPNQVANIWKWLMVPRTLVDHDRCLKRNRNIPPICPLFLGLLKTSRKEALSLSNEIRKKCKRFWSFQFWKTNENDTNWKMVFCYQNCSDLLWEKIVIVIEKTFQPRICKNEITRTIYSNSESSEQILVTECFFNLFPKVSQIWYIRLITIQIIKN